MFPTTSSGLDCYLLVSSGRDMDYDVFVDCGADDFAAVSAVEASDVRASADETDPQRRP